MTMRKNKNIREQASQWLTELSAEEVSSDTRRRFEAWYNASPDHQKTYQQMERLLEDLEVLQELSSLEPPEPQTLREKLVSIFSKGLLKKYASVRKAAVWAPAAALAFIAMIVTGIYMTRFQPHEYATEIAEIRDVTLPDGSTVVLGAHSSVVVDFTDVERRVLLERGEAFFAVVKQLNRPFVVGVDDTLIRVVGTKFDVHKGVSEVRVAVAEGIVEVTHRGEVSRQEDAGEAFSKSRLLAGEQVVVPRQGPARPVQKIRADQPGAWQNGRLIYENASLAEIIADANRYYDGHIHIASEELARQRFTSVFRTNQIEDMISTLALGLPIEIEHISDKDIVLKQKTSP